MGRLESGDAAPRTVFTGSDDPASRGWSYETYLAAKSEANRAMGACGLTSINGTVCPLGGMSARSTGWVSCWPLSASEPSCACASASEATGGMHELPTLRPHPDGYRSLRAGRWRSVRLHSSNGVSIAMMIIVPLVMAAMMLVAVIVIGTLTFAGSVAGLAVGAAARSADRRTVRTIVMLGGAFGFCYAWLAIGAIRESGAEYLITIMIKIAVCMLAASLILLVQAGCLKLIAVRQTRGGDGTAASPVAVAWIGMATGFAVLLAIEYATTGYVFPIDIVECARFASFQKYGPLFDGSDFLYCIDASR